MANAPLSLNIEYFTDTTTGKPAFKASVWIGKPDLDPEIEANRVDVTIVQEDGTTVLISPANQPLKTGASGRIDYLGNPVVVLVDGSYSIKVRNQQDKQIYFAPRANEVIPEPVDRGVSVLNGSFEFETVTGLSDNWTFAATTTGTIAPDGTSQAHGLKSLKFISVDGTGAGIATSDRFDTAENTDLDVTFIYKASNAATLNKVEIKFYNSSGAAISTVIAYTNGTTNPTTYTHYFRRITVPANGIEAEVILTGLDPLGTVTSGNANFDDISVIESNPVIESINLDNAVNRVSISDAATGNNPAINASGEDVGIDIEGVTNKNGNVSAPSANITTVTSTTTNTTTVNATDVNTTNINGILFGFRGALVYPTTNKVMTAFVEFIEFDAEIYDTSNIHDNAVNNTRLTVPVGVSYVRLSAGTRLSGSTSGVMGISVYKNNSISIPITSVIATAVTDHRIMLTGPIEPVIAGDYFEIEAYEGTSDTITITAGFTWFAMEIIE